MKKILALAPLVLTVSLSIFLSTGMAFPVEANQANQANLVTPADWPLFQHNPSHTGQATPSQRIAQPVIRWKQPVGIAGWLNYPLIADGQVFISSSGYLWQIPDYEAGNESDSLLTDGVYAFDLKTGTRNWYAPGKADVSGIAYENGRLFATGDEGAVWALDARSGELKWRQELGAETYQVLVHQQVVYVGNAEGVFFALDAQTGKIRWKTALKGSIRAGAALQGDRLVVGTTSGKVYGLSLKGKIRWEQDLLKLYPEYVEEQYAPSMEVYASATLYKNSAIIGFARDTLYPTPALVSFDLLTGKLLWKAESDGERTQWGNIRTSPVLYKDYLIYAEPYSNDAVAVNAQTGKALGSTAIGVPMLPQWASPALSGSTVILPRHDGGLYTLDAEKGDPGWALYIGEPRLAGSKFPEGIATGGGATYSHPTIGDAVFSSPAISKQGHILVAAGGYLYCIGDKSW